MNYQLLTDEDFKMARLYNTDAAISWPLSDGTYLKSFNKWQCYSLDQIKLATVVVENQGPKCIPAIEINQANRLIQLFDIDIEENWDCERVISQWNELIKDQKSICLFGAFTQLDVKSNLLWNLEIVKTSNGYWDRSEEVELLENDDGAKE